MALTLAQMLALLADNTSGDISAEDMRDIVTAIDDRCGFNIGLVGTPNSYSTFTNAPNSETFWGQNARSVTFADLTNMRECRLIVGVNVASTSPNTPVCRLKYFTSASSTGSNYLSIAASGNVQVSIATQGVFKTEWTALAAGAKADVAIAPFGDGGDADKDPSIRAAVQFR